MKEGEICFFKTDIGDGLIEQISDGKLDFPFIVEVCDFVHYDTYSGIVHLKVLKCDKDFDARSRLEGAYIGDSHQKGETISMEIAYFLKQFKRLDKKKLRKHKLWKILDNK